MIIKRIVDNFASLMQNNGIVEDKDLAIMKYGMTCFLNEFTKIFALFIIFAFSGHLPIFLFDLLILVSIKTTTGGIHFDTNLKCFIATFLVFVLSMFVLPDLLPLTMAQRQLTLTVSILLIIILAPVLSQHRPKLSKKRILLSKIRSLLVTLIWSLLLLSFVNDQRFSLTGIWMIFVISIQLLIGKVFEICRSKKGEKRYE